MNTYKHRTSTIQNAFTNQGSGSTCASGNQVRLHFKASEGLYKSKTGTKQDQNQALTEK